MKKKLLVFLLPLLVATGCVQLNDDQKKELALAKAELRESRDAAAAAARGLAELAPQVKAAIEALKEGRTGEAGRIAVAVYKEVTAKEDELKKNFETAVDKGKAAKERGDKIVESGVPWHQVAGSFLLDNSGYIIAAILAGVGGRKYVKVRTALGVVSRALTFAADDSAGDAVTAELSGSSLTTEDMRTFKSLAAAGKI